MSKLPKALASMRATGKNRIKLQKISTDSCAGIKDKEQAKRRLEEMQDELNLLQEKLYAESKRGLLIVFQAIDTGGKDGVIRRVFGPLNPQGVAVSSFKRPSTIDLSHDYLWRIHPFIPAKGTIRIFNRSHYEDVLVHRVHGLLPLKTIERRYHQINDFERYLTENDVSIIKFFLHISKDEQKRRLEERLAYPDKRWKFELGDLEERKYWDKYQDAFNAMLNHCSSPDAPWYTIPSDRKWYRDWAVAEIVCDALEGIKPKYPHEQEGLDDVVIE